MSTNYMLSNNGVPQTVFSQPSITPQRTRAVSACSNPGIPVVSHYHPTFSQAYQTLTPMDSWAHAQQGVYVNGLGKVMNVFAGGTMSEVDDMLNQASETYKYAHGMKVPNVGPQSGGHLYQQPPTMTGGTHHATLQTLNPQIQLALAAAPNGVAQSQPNAVPTSSLRTDQPNAIPHQHPTSSSLYVPRLVGQQAIPHHQNPVSPSVFTDTMGTGNGMHTLTPYHTKHVSSINGPNAGRAVPNQLPTSQPPLNPQNYASGLPIAQHHTGPHPSHPQLYSATSLPTAPPHLSSAMPHGVVEFLPAVFPSDPNTQNQFNQQSAAMFTHQYASQMATAYEPSSAPVETPYNARVRHNTWSGLESTVALRSLDQVTGDKMSTNPQSLGHPTHDASRTGPQRSHTSDNTVPFGSSNHPYGTSTGRSSSLYFPAAHRPGVIELPSSIGFSVQNNVQLPPPRDRDLSNTNNSNCHVAVSKSNKNESASKSGAQWGGTVNPIRQQPQWATVPSHPHNSLFSSAPLNANAVLSAEPIYNSFTTNAQQRGTLTSQSNRDAFRRGRDSEPQTTGSTHSSQLVSTRTRNGIPMGSQSGKSRGQTLGGMRSFPASRPFNSTELETNKQLQGQFSALNFPNVINTSGFVTASTPWNLQTNPVTHPSNLGRIPHPNGIRFSQGLLPHQTLPFLFQNHVPNLDQSHFHRQKFPQSLRRLGPNDPGNMCASPGMGELLINGTPQANGLRCILDACPTRVLISTALVGAVIGRGGRTIRSITSKTGAQIDFKQETVAFSQFALQGGLRNFNTGRSNESSDKSTIPDSQEPVKVAEVEGEEAVPATDRPSSPTQPPTTTTGPQLNRSQIVLIFGSREQCSTAVAEMLAVCFRESEHKGLSDPCLGLLIQQQIYSQLLMGHGRKYFNRIHAATGARVTVTGTPAHVEPIKPDEVATTSPSADTNLDRIVVVRGQLPAICAAEAYISEHVRCITAEQIIPPTLWPLLPHLPLASLTSSTSGTGRGRHSSSGIGLSELHALTNVVLSIADVFWPHSVSAKLTKHPSFAQASHSTATVPHNLEDQQKLDDSAVPIDDLDHKEDKNDVTQPTSEPEATSPQENNLNHVPSTEADSTVLDEVSSSSNDLMLDGVDSGVLDLLDGEEKELVEGAHQEDEERPCTPTPFSPKESPPLLHSEESNADVATHSRVHSLSATELDFVAEIRNSLNQAIGPAAWLATSGMLHMRVSFNEAGILIGAGGHRIHQLIQSTGSDIYIGKTPISGPYALNQANRLNRSYSAEKPRRVPAKLTTDNAASEHCDPDESSSTVDAETTEEQQDEQLPLSESVPLNPRDDIPDTPRCEEAQSSETGAAFGTTSQPHITPDSPETEVATPEQPSIHPVTASENIVAVTGSDKDQPSEQTTDESLEANTVNSPDSTMQSSPKEVPSDSTKANLFNPSSSSSYRLVTLSGPFESQLIAHWRIFDRLNMLHHRQRVNDTTDANPVEPATSTIGSSCPKTMPPLRLATLVCLPYRFLCWFTSTHVGFESLVSGVPSESPEDSSPLNWLQSKAMGMMKRHYEDTDSVKVIHVLPEPRRRRRLVQQQLRRAGLSRRAPSIMASPPLMPNAKPIFLPSIGLTHDGLDQLWSDPNRVPMEIFADHETTMVVVMWLKHLLAMWLYGQALANPSGFTQAPSLFLVPRSPMRPNQNSFATPYHPTGGSPHTTVDWSHAYWPAAAAALSDYRTHSSSNGRRLPPQAAPFQDFYGRQQRPRYPAFGNKWHPTQDPTSLQFSTDQSRQFGFHPFALSGGYPSFPGPITSESILAATAFGSPTGPYSHNPAVHPSGANLGSSFTHPWTSLPFVWDHTSFLNRPFGSDPPRRQNASMSHRPNPTRRTAAPASSSIAVTTGTLTHTDAVVAQPTQSEVPESQETAKPITEPTSEE